MFEGTVSALVMSTSITLLSFFFSLGYDSCLKVLLEREMGTSANISFFLSFCLSLGDNSCLKVHLCAVGKKCVTCGLIALSGERADEFVGHVCHGVFSSRV